MIKEKIMSTESDDQVNTRATMEKQAKKDREKKFIKMIAALHKRGVRVDVFFKQSVKDAEEYTRYDPNRDIVYVEACDSEGLLEELIHRAQFKALKKEYGSLEALVESNMVDAIRASAEIGAKFLTIRKMMRELESKRDSGGISEKLKSDINVQKFQILVYAQHLHDSLKDLNREQIERLRQILNHPLFAGAQEILNLIQDGIDLEQIFYKVQNETKSQAE